MNVLICSGSRGEWGYYTPIIRELTKRNHKYDVVTMNMAAVSEYGSLHKEILQNGFNLKYNVYSSFHGGDHYSMAKGFSSLCSSFSDILHNNSYDWAIIAGDRFEQLAVANICSLMGIPTAHVQAGERSGNIDGISRHVIGKLVHLHFAANDDAKKRLIALGEAKWRVIKSGAPQLDDVFDYYKDDADTPTDNSVVFVYHGLTEEIQKNYIGMVNAFNIIKGLKLPTTVILPNNDAGGLDIKNYILDNKFDGCNVIKNIGRRDFFRLIAKCRFMIGNSSCSLIEAPVYKKGCINIGNRQNKRVCGDNVINCGYGKQSILSAIKKLECKSFRNQVAKCKSPYGSMPASPIIVDELERKLKLKPFKLIYRGITK